MLFWDVGDPYARGICGIAGGAGLHSAGFACFGFLNERYRESRGGSVLVDDMASSVVIVAYEMSVICKGV
jgi:hypothetical protein